MAPTKLMPCPYMQFLDDNGNPLSYGKVYTYYAGTTDTEKYTYTDWQGTTPHTNPITLDAAGRAVIYLTTGNYKIVVYDADGNLIRSVDYVNGSQEYVQVNTVAALKLVSTSPPPAIIWINGYRTNNDGGQGWFYWNSGDSATADNGIIIAPDDGGAGRWRRFFSGDIDIRWYGAVTGGTDANAYNASAITAAASYANTAGRAILISGGTFKLASTVSVSVPMRFEPYGAFIWDTFTPVFSKIIIEESDTTQHFFYDTGTMTGFTMTNPVPCRAEWWGAVGNGIQDNSYKLNHALMCVRGELLFGNGTFNFDRLTIRGDIFFKGNGNTVWDCTYTSSEAAITTVLSANTDIRFERLTVQTSTAEKFFENVDTNGYVKRVHFADVHVSGFEKAIDNYACDELLLDHVYLTGAGKTASGSYGVKVGDTGRTSYFTSITNFLIGAYETGVKEIDSNQLLLTNGNIASCDTGVDLTHSAVITGVKYATNDLDVNLAAGESVVQTEEDKIAMLFSQSGGGVSIATYSDDDAAASDVTLKKSHSDAVADVATTDADIIGKIDFKGVNSTPASVLMASIEAVQDGSAGASYNKANINFKTGSATGAPATNLMVLTPDADKECGIAVSQYSGAEPYGVKVGDTNSGGSGRRVLTVADNIGVASDYDTCSPIWYKYTISYTSVQAASTSKVINLALIPALSLVHAVAIRCVTQFAGVANVKLDVGNSSDDENYVVDFPCSNPAHNELWHPVTVNTSLLWGLFPNGPIQTIATFTGDSNLSNLSAGSVTIYLLISKLE